MVEVKAKKTRILLPLHSPCVTIIDPMPYLISVLSSGAFGLPLLPGQILLQLQHPLEGRLLLRQGLELEDKVELDLARATEVLHGAPVLVVVLVVPERTRTDFVQRPAALMKNKIWGGITYFSKNEWQLHRKS